MFLLFLLCRSKWLKENLRVYAICACSEDRGMYTGEWQRVEVLKCDEFAEVLFLDSGGCETVLPSSLYKIHQQHCKYPPICMQLCIQGLCDADIKRAAIGEWSDKCKENWRKLLREDVLIGLSILKCLNSTCRSSPQIKELLPYQRPNVIFVQRVRIHGEEKLVTKSFSDPALGVGRARCDETRPIEWLYD
uniref:Tudor domain-containing protein n=1 Tax=Heterorhabditis bacteriophora TaxID=37862 RepID=A0A1I7XEI7_HETBA